jgi:hypothetical protein
MPKRSTDGGQAHPAAKQVNRQRVTYYMAPNLRETLAAHEFALGRRRPTAGTGLAGSVSLRSMMVWNDGRRAGTRQQMSRKIGALSG